MTGDDPISDSGQRCRDRGHSPVPIANPAPATASAHKSLLLTRFHTCPHCNFVVYYNR